jgi:hypothetical protein
VNTGMQKYDQPDTGHVAVGWIKPSRVHGRSILEWNIRSIRAVAVSISTSYIWLIRTQPMSTLRARVNV